MDWHSILAQVRAAYFSLNGIDRLSHPPTPYTIQDLVEHHERVETSLRSDVDSTVLEHFNSRAVPATHDHAYLVQYRYYTAIILLLGLTSDCSPTAPEDMTEEQAFRWLLIESWPTHGYSIWKLEDDSFTKAWCEAGDLVNSRHLNCQLLGCCQHVHVF